MNEFNRNLINIDDLIKGGEREYIKEYITGLHPADIADIIKTLDEDKKREIFNLLHAEVASRVIVEIDDRSREQILEDINRERLVDIVGVMDSDKAADLIADLPQDNAEKILENLPWKDSAEVQKLLKYSEDTAGGIMHTELLSVREEVLVEDAIIQFMAISEEIGNIHDTFIIDKNRQLVGVMPVRKLLLIKPETPISRVMDRHIISVNVHTDQEEVARVFKKYDLVSLAVVDKEDRLMGRILIDDIVDVLIEEASEDMLHMAGIYQDEKIMDPPLRSVRIRLPWLVINLATAILAASVVGLFQDTLQAMVILAMFMPIVAGMGGNAGTQALAVTVRGIALGELDFGNAKKALLNSTIAGLLNGIATGAIMALVAYYWKGNYMLGIVIGLAMIINLFIANFFGIIIPLVLKWLKIDPAVASSIFLTTLTDCIGFISFLGLATFFIKYLI
ncbi:MAG: magnesium transporter [Nitrospinae bacterium RIFCSPLOWO2_02_FULL_39_110]|nr:MAG: magnesium transporter [Nitrospinae bacterium RIFCSPHIGHO2_02_39_11]OGW00207.1 MAG: magnesium transporter [Nitrospinae bacterium RIFCSPHIGHO2_12_FULL_39_42]OGW00382.1 MAG: magnesium transporter [Nitrospinae bacterium RIFCSPHIGHO2_02_FULL_39_82]OGW03727.1 MAG: magnesium transporter [Nitrospinae bacterium RIFCSPLOWO2_02_39_17]OGW04092.1 MAG: magnesium transporter [Nitrospinae bacterium RIFCSPLOWO2_02_FULL_39_110]OGW12152.1 MAG: magnesium transporter [Nitrospinae bacterium RIFCSPLOWO2_12_F